MVKTYTEPKEFHMKLSEQIYSKYDFGWILEGKNKNPSVGAVFGINSGNFITVDDIVWFPWATSRNKIECLVKFFAEIRHKHLLIFNIREEDKDFFVHISKHGVIRRVGKIDGLYEKQATLFQTRV